MDGYDITEFHITTVASLLQILKSFDVSFMISFYPAEEHTYFAVFTQDLRFWIYPDGATFSNVHIEDPPARLGEQFEWQDCDTPEELSAIFLARAKIVVGGLNK